MRLRRLHLSMLLAAIVLTPIAASADLASHVADDDAAPESRPSGLKPIEVHLGVGGGGLSMKGSSAFEYNDGTQLQLKTKSESMRPAASLAVYLNISGLSYETLQISPYVSADLLFGGVLGARGSVGLRAMYGHKKLRPWVSLGAGYAQFNGVIATVPGGTFLNAPDQSRVKPGTEISGFASSLGGDLRVGANYAITASWGVSALVGYSLFQKVTDWEARATNEAGQEISLGKLTGLPAASLTGPVAFVGVTYSYER